MAIGWTTERSEFESLYGQEMSLHVVQTGSGAHPTAYPMGKEVKRQERQADHSPTTAEVKKMWINTFTSSYA
jgi:hypothetical protein